MPQIPYSCLERLEAVDSLEALKAQTQALVLRLGFERFVYVLDRRANMATGLPAPFIFGTYDPEYLAIYQKEQFFRWDAAAHHLITRKTPWIWESAAFASPASQAMYAVATRFGIRGGIVFPLEVTSPFIAGLGIATASSPEAVREQALKALPHGQLLAVYVHAAVQRLLLPDYGKHSDKLTRREIECLELAARGLRDQEIADRLCISTRTVILHLANARHKLNAENRMQMIAKAMAFKLIEI